MIRKVHIQNFKCLRDVELALSPLTVLVGANASGKSAILEALRFTVGQKERTIWRRDHSLTMRVRAERTAGDEEKAQEFAELVWTENDRKVRRTGTAPDTQFLRFQLDRLREDNQPQRQSKVRLNADGGNLTNVFVSLGRQQQAELASWLGRLVPQYRDVENRPSQEGYLRLEFQDRWSEDLWYQPSEVSDGTMLTLAFLILRFQKPAPELLLIEEPERGLHPFLLEQLVALARGLSTATFGGDPIQVVMATHSAELLEHLEPDEVRFLKRVPEDGSTRVEAAPTQSPDWERAFEEYARSLGNAWLSGGLGGVPGTA